MFLFIKCWSLILFGKYPDPIIFKELISVEMQVFPTIVC